MKKIVCLLLAIVLGTASAVPFLNVAYADDDFPVIPSDWEDSIPEELQLYYYTLKDQYSNLVKCTMDVLVDAELKDAEWVVDLVNYVNDFYDLITWFHDDYVSSYEGKHPSHLLPGKPEGYSDWSLFSDRLIYSNFGINVYDGSSSISSGQYIASDDMLNNLVDPYLPFRTRFRACFLSDRFYTKPLVYEVEYHIGNRYEAGAWVYLPSSSSISNLRIRFYKGGFVFAVDPLENKPCLINIISPYTNWRWSTSVRSELSGNDFTFYPDGSTSYYRISNDSTDTFWDVTFEYDVWQYIPLVTVYANNDNSQETFPNDEPFPIPPEFPDFFYNNMPDSVRQVVIQSQKAYSMIEDLLVVYAPVHPIDLDQFKYGILAFPFDFVSDFHSAIIDGYSPTFHLSIDSLDIMGYHIWDDMNFELDPRSLFGSDLWFFISNLFVFVLSANLIFTTFRKFFGGDSE